MIFFFFNAGSADRILIFATDDNLRHLCDLETIYVDRTQICPSLFIQLFTINSFIHGQQFLLIYASLEVDKVTTKQMNEAVREELQHQQSDAVWSRKKRLMCTSPMNSKQRLASTQPKMIIVLPLRSLRATLMGNWEKAQSTYSSRSTTKN